MSTETKPQKRRVGVGWEANVEFDVPVVKTGQIILYEIFMRDSGVPARTSSVMPRDWLYQLLGEDLIIRDEENRSPPSSTSYKI